MFVVSAMNQRSAIAPGAADKPAPHRPCGRWGYMPEQLMPRGLEYDVSAS